MRATNPSAAAAARSGDSLEKNTFRYIDYILLLRYIVPTLSYPREVSRTSRGWDRGRWPVKRGAKTYTPPRQPKLHGPDALAGASLGTHGGGVVRRLPSARRRRWSPSGGEASAPEREGSLKSNDHRGSRSIRLKHRARDAGEMADLRSYRLRLSAARRSGPRVRQDPGVPRRPHFFGGAAFAKLGRKTRRENEEGCPKPADEIR
jgi:hypothetical protein